MGQYQKKLYTELESTYPNFVSDFNKEYSKQKIALQLVELRLETGLSQRKYAKANELCKIKFLILKREGVIRDYRPLLIWLQKMDTRLN